MTEQSTSPEVILNLYADGPAKLEAALAGLSEPDLNLALTSDSWTIRQIVHHIVDGDDLWKTCIKAAIGNSEGSFTLQWYWDKPQTEWAENWGYARRSIEPSLALLRANRCLIYELVQRTPNVLERSIRLKNQDREEERISVGDVLVGQTNHVLGHIKDIQVIRQAHNL